MFKILLALLLMTSQAMAQQWEGGTGEQTILGSSYAALIGYNSYNKIVAPLNNLLWNTCNEYLTYTSSNTITVSAGACVVSSSASTPIRLFMQDKSATLLTWSNLDTGSQVASTTYYVYSTAATNSSTNSTYYISASNTAPSGQIYYYQIGSFTTDANTNITQINNNIALGTNVGPLVSKSTGVVYQALTDIDAGCYGNPSSGQSSVLLEIGTTTSPNIQVGTCGSDPFNIYCSFSWLVPKGDYYEFSGGVSGSACYIESTSK